eukprot:Skav232593  [mRNA]  locus=scaffold2040:91961:97396:- [translate_table: standard]
MGKGILFDPLISSNGDEFSRPNTFAKTAAKNDSSSDLVTSIDGILLNQAAFQFVKDAVVKRCIGLQHAYVELSFDWPSAGESRKSKHFKWVPHAALDLQNLQPLRNREQTAKSLWESDFASRSGEANNAEEMFELFNQFALEILLRSGQMVSFFEFSKASLHQVCIRAASEELYRRSVSSARKDLVDDGSGIIDPQVPQWLVDSAHKHIPWPDVEKWNVNENTLDVWLGVGTANFHHAWSRTFAILAFDDTGNVLFSFTYGDFTGSVYKAYVALLWYVSQCSDQKVRVFTNNDRLLQDWEVMRVDPALSERQPFADWWKDIIHATNGCQRLQLLHVNSDGGISRCLRPNVRAINHAATNAVLKPKQLAAWKQHTMNHVGWLCSLSKLLSKTNAEREEPVNSEPMDSIVQVGTVAIDVANRFSKWDWAYSWEDYTWKMQPGMLSLPAKWPFSEDVWIATVSFFEKLVWRIDDRAATSIYELSYYFYKNLPCFFPTILEINRGHFVSVADWLRHFMRIAKKQGVHLFPPQCRIARRSTKVTQCPSMLALGACAAAARSIVVRHSVRGRSGEDGGAMVSQLP